MHAFNFAQTLKRNITNKQIVEDLKNSSLTAQDVLVKGWFEPKNAFELAKIGFENTEKLLKQVRTVLAIPYYDENKNIIFYRIRLYPPLTDNDGKLIKYLQPKGVDTQPYILPEIWNLKTKTSKPLIITEGEKKCITLNKFGYPAIGLSGVFNFQKNNRFNEALNQFDWHNRKVYVCFDSDCTENINVLHALIRLALHLSLRGANVWIIKIPSPAPTIKTGVDDLIAKSGLEAFKYVYETASSFYEILKPEHTQLLKNELVEIAQKNQIDKQQLERVVENLRIYLKWKKGDVKDLLKKCERKEPQKTLLQQSTEHIYLFVKKFFFDEKDDLYAVLHDDRYFKTNTRSFYRLAHKHVNEQLNTTVSPDLIKNAIKNLEAMLTDTNVPKRSLMLRTAIYDEYLYFDLGDFRSVKITKGSWDIVPSPPIFERYPHQDIQVDPERADVNDLWRIFEVVNIPEDKLEERILFLTYLLYSFIPGNPYPILTVYGDHGSGKSTAQLMLRRLIDPVKNSELISFTNIEDLRVIAATNYFIPIDNLSFITQSTSDELCKIATGGGFMKRMLYTDSDLVYYGYKRPICISGINLIANFPDLIDRSILIKFDLNQISKIRITEEKINQKINELRPVLLGAIFEILSNIWMQVEDIPYVLPRMSTYSLYGFHFAEVLGVGGLNFLQAYNRNRSEGISEIISSDALANVIFAYFEKNGHGFNGSPNIFYNELKELALELNINEKDLPGSASWLVRKLNVLKPSLEELGIKIEIEHNGRQRLLTVQKLDVSTVDPKTEDEHVPF